MEHRHLLPDEIELLVDGEEGFGTAPLVAHIERCEQCRIELDAQKRVAAELERLPHFMPSPLFAYKVLKSVQVFEPWQVTAADTARRFVPQSRLGRVFAGAAAALIGTTMTLCVLPGTPTCTVRCAVTQTPCRRNILSELR